MKAQLLKWKTCPFNDRYEVSNMGQVRIVKPYYSRPVGELLRLTVNKNGYVYVELRQLKKTKRYMVHRLVLATFKGHCPDGKEGCHKNGKRTDNRLNNLYWGTRKENIADSVKHGTHSSGFKLKWETDRAYMTSLQAGKWLGKKHTEATKQKIRIARAKQSSPSLETRMKLSKSLRGRHISDDIKQKISEGNKAAWRKRRGI